MAISRVFLAAVLLPILAGCTSGEANEEPSNTSRVEVSERVLQSAPETNEDVPLPRPTGERQIGVRLSEYRIEMTKETVPAGEIEFQVANAGNTIHYLVVRSDEVYSITRHLPPGDTTVMKVALEPGEYDYLCAIRDEFDHYSEGMRGHLVVQ